MKLITFAEEFEMAQRKKDYMIGLDIGTSSVGWAVIDDKFNLLRKKKKNLFGVYLFDEGETAAGRRVQRSTRRRFSRRRQRLALLRELFAPEMKQVDPSFFLRLAQSKLNIKDEKKKFAGYTLFNDPNYSDQDFYREYPTIFHLRKAMIEQDKQFDLRQIYLVAANIIKYRGNFTDEAQNLDGSEESIETILTEFLETYNRQIFGDEETLFDVAKISKLIEIIYDQELTASDRQRAVVQELLDNKENKDKLTEFSKLILGLKANLAKLFALESEDSLTIKLADRNVETQLVEVENTLESEDYLLFEMLQKVFAKVVLHKILKDQKYLSFARVESYDKHRSDLQILKQMWRDDIENHSKEVQAAKDAYDQYINHGQFAEDFYKDLNKYLKVASNQAQVALITKDIESNNYLPKQRTNQNGAIPYQIHHQELKKILENQSKYYPFLTEAEDGISTKDKILAIHKFRIPYYVGPLVAKEKSEFAWMVRKEPGKILPWNFDDKVDRDQSSMKFITKMTGTDTYLLGEPVLPKRSLVYQKFEVLNELNKIRINDAPIDVTLKQNIFNEVFKKHRKVTTKLIKKYLVKNGYYKVEKDIRSISGLSRETEFTSSLSTYLDLVKVFGHDFVESHANQEFLEEIVVWLTVFEDKKILDLRLKKSEQISKEQARMLMGYRYSGWGELSQRLLENVASRETKIGSVYLNHDSILNILWKTNLNFMQIINDQNIGIDQQIKEANGENQENVADLIDSLGGSPAIKKGIRQAIKVVDDLVKFMGEAPAKIYLEFARDDQASQRTKSRYKQLDEKYKAIKKLANAEAPGLLNNIKTDKSLKAELDRNKDNLSSERLFLYFLQGGKSLYSGKPLDINKLREYEVDHILPQAYTKDDSIENKALVLRNENQNKTNKMFLDPEIIRTMLPVWEAMKKANLIGPKKFKNLTRRGISENEERGFINRQLVETRQIIKNVADILDKKYGAAGTKTSAVKANLSSEFRNAFDLPKSRNVNDYHHAHDAYLSAFLGSYIDQKYPNLEDANVYKSFNKYVVELRDKLRKQGKISVLRQSYIIGQLQTKQADTNGDIFWDSAQIETIRKIFNYKQMNVVKKTEVRSGALYKETIFAPGAKNNLIPLKKDLDPDMYGGYSSQQFAYSVLCDIDAKQKKLVGIPVAVAHEIEDDRDELQRWLKDNAQYKNSIEILIAKVPIYQKVWSQEKGNLILSSPKEIQNGQQLVLSQKSYQNLAKLEKTPDAKVTTFAEEEKIDLTEIYQEIVAKMAEIYPFYASEQKRLAAEENLDAFKNFAEQEDGRLEQFQILEELLKTLHANAVTGNIKFGNIKTGMFGRRPNGYPMNNTYFIYQSPTGLFEHRRYIN